MKLFVEIDLFSVRPDYNSNSFHSLISPLQPTTPTGLIFKSICPETGCGFAGFIKFYPAGFGHYRLSHCFYRAIHRVHLYLKMGSFGNFLFLGHSGTFLESLPLNRPTYIAKF
jgi:hypothetical protein